uniref:Glycosyltransferase 2-like domain-containing protein n=1 Tax=Arcella intermedia TaxID=1963864 RepID=A0A6B2LEU5_9EUKA
MQSSGNYLCFLDADDIMMPDRIAMQYEACKNNPNAIIGSNFERFPPESTQRYSNWCNNITPEQLYTQRFREVTIIQPTWFYERVIWDRLGGYEPAKGLPEDLIFFLKHLEQGGKLHKVPVPLLKYRYHTTMTSSGISRKTLLSYRVQAFERTVLRDPKWSSFMIWGCGRDGKTFYKTLSAQNQLKVVGFCDVNPNLIGTSIVLNHQTKHKIPVLHWNQMKAPFVTCVAFDRYDQFETNLKSLNFIEGIDYFPLI